MRGAAAGAALPGLLAAEAAKLRTLPAVTWVIAGTAAAAAGLAAAVASSSPEGTAAVSVLARIVPFLQAGTVLLGALAAGSEYGGSQIRTTLVAMPRRGELLTAKALVTAGSLLLTAALAVLGALTAAGTVLMARGTGLGEVVTQPGLAAGAGAYLTALGMLGFALAVLLRAFVPALVTMVAATSIASPLLAAQSEHARWLPDQAGSLLYDAVDDAVLTPATGALVLTAWIAAAGALGATAFLRRDA